MPNTRANHQQIDMHDHMRNERRQSLASCEYLEGESDACHDYFYLEILRPQGNSGSRRLPTPWVFVHRTDSLADVMSNITREFFRTGLPPQVSGISPTKYMRPKPRWWTGRKIGDYGKMLTKDSWEVLRDRLILNNERRFLVKFVVKEDPVPAAGGRDGAAAGRYGRIRE